MYLLTYLQFKAQLSCIISECAINFESHNACTDDQTDTNCLRDMDSPSQHLLQGKSISFMQGVSG